jgi:hypothetical protein
MKKLALLMFVLLAACTRSPAPCVNAAPAPTLPDVATPEASAPAAPTASETRAGVAQCPTPAQLDTDLTAASQAAVISLSGLNPLTCPEVTMTETWAGGKLIFSDSPETPTDRGKLYEDGTLPATSGSDYNRVFAYHVNGRSAKSRFTVLLKNTSASAGTLTVQRRGTAGPTTSFLYAGKLAFERWLNAAAATPVNVAAGATVRLDTTFDVTDVNTGNLLHGIWDYSFGQTHQVTICILATNDAPLTVCPTLAVLARDTHKRGTFPYADKVYDTASGVIIDTAAGVQQFPVAGGTATDAFAVGVDVTDGTAMTNAGNYGVLYRMHIATSASDGQNIGFLINPRAGQWGGAAWTLAGLLPGGKFLIPAASGSTGDNAKGAVEGRYNLSATPAPWAQFMPTGGSSFPVRFVAVPH